MPQIQVVNTSRDEPEPRGLQNFFSNLNRHLKERADETEIGNLISQYQQSKDKESAWEELMLNLEKSNVSPSKRLEKHQALTDIRKLSLEQEKINAAKTRAANPKEPLANQAINTDQLKAIQLVRSDPSYEEASPSKKYQMLTDAGVSKANAEAEAKIYAEEEKSKPGAEYAKGREKTVQGYVDNAIAQGEAAEEMKLTIDTARQAIMGDVAGPGFEALAKNNPYIQLYTGLTPDEATLQASNKKLLEGTKGIFGSKPTEREIFLLLNSMLPSIGKTPEANLAGLQVIERFNDYKLLHSDIVDALTEGGTKYVPDLEKRVKEKMKPAVEELRKDLLSAQQSLQDNEKIKVRAPDGTIGEITRAQLNKAKENNVIFTPIKK